MVNLACKKFSNSIDPTTIPKSNKEIKQLLECLGRDAPLYLNSVQYCDSFVSHFQESILPRLEQNKLVEKFLDQTKRYATAELAKTTFIAASLEKILEKTVEDIEWWMEKYSKEAKFRRREPETLNPNHLIDTVKIAYEDFVHLSVLLSQMFLALEFSCKMLCAFGCYRFALKVSQSEVIQHKEVWKQLEKLAQKKGYDCETCVVKASCNFKIDFSALASIYAYSMKVRQVADYTTRLASLNIFKSGLFSPPFTYFSSLIEIVENNFFLGKRCLPERYLSSVAAPFLVFQKRRKELYAPFSWDEKELKRLTAKQPKDALAWYLLGKLYFKRNDVFEAIECLEEAKKLDSHHQVKLKEWLDSFLRERKKFERYLKMREKKPARTRFL